MARIGNWLKVTERAQHWGEADPFDLVDGGKDALWSSPWLT